MTRKSCSIRCRAITENINLQDEFRVRIIFRVTLPRAIRFYFKFRELLE
jgi:hypothetical protein